MKNLLILFVLPALFTKAQTVNPMTQPFNLNNPSGYYSLDSATTGKNGDKYGYFGTINVMQVDTSRIVVNFYVCKGAPGYNTGYFEDTLQYKNGVAVYTTSDDNTCVITFNFNAKDGVAVEEKTKKSFGGCGFGNEVVATGFYRKIVERDSTGKIQ